MEQSLKKYIIVGVLLLLCGCRSSGPFSSLSIGSYQYETYAPVKETLSFHNDRCIYTYYDVLENKAIADTCFWKLTKDYAIILYKRANVIDPTLKYLEDSAENAQLSFTYEICPKWYNIKKWEFQKHTAYRSPIYQERSMSLPLGISPEERAQILRDLHPTFADKYGRYKIVSDTIINLGSVLIWKKKLRTPAYLYATNKQIPQKIDVPYYIKEAICSLPSTSYEFLNYHINYGNSGVITQDSLTGKQFSFIGVSSKKECIQFVNDSICTHSIFSRVDMSSPYVPIIVDTCHYTIKNNLLAIDFACNKGLPYDSLTYCNGILFYSKVYKNSEGENYSHVVKPFIDEKRSCTNKTDSINMIMSNYLNVYVPLNLYKSSAHLDKNK